MNINRHNYEEFFLLYVDNELSAAERKTVDVFVQENPDLKGELLLLQDTVAEADDITLGKKDWLFMEEGATALQENLLLYADDELDASDKKTTEALLATDRSAQAEWNILRQTKLQPDTSIVFEDKRSLYRTERGRIVAFNWRRVAAAAVLLGLGLWTAISVYKNNSETIPATGNIVKENKINSGQGKNTVTSNTSVAQNPVNDNNPTQQSATALLPEPKSLQAGIDNKTQTAARVSDQNQGDKNINATAISKKPADVSSNPSSENFNRKGSNEMIVAAVLPKNMNTINASGINNGIVKPDPNEKPINTEVAGMNKGTTDPTTTAAIPVLYVNNTDENNNNRFLYMDEEKVKRTRLGGFIRKAKRILERSTNISTGEGLQVAGFEIALK